MLTWLKGLLKWAKSANAQDADMKWKLTISIPFKQTGDKVSDLILKRRWYTDHSTIGELYLGDERLCYTLEDTVRRGTKIWGKTAISTGRYEVIVNFSDRFKKMMPLLLNVPDYEGVRIHSGNTDADTEGCILVGLDMDADVILRSRDAFNVVFPRIQEIITKEKLYIQIANLGKHEP